MNLLAFPSTDHKAFARIHCSETEHEKPEERLWRSGYLALRDVSCIAIDDVVYLHGCLSSYYLKQVAQEIAGGLAGVRHVINRIEVLPRQTGPQRRVRAESLRNQPSRNITRGEGWSSPNARPTKGVSNDVSSEPQTE